MKDRGTRTWGWALGLSVVLALIIGVASAKKPPKPPPEPPPAGTIVYSWNDRFFEMAPDGSDPTEIAFNSAYTGGLSVAGGRAAVSRERHNGKVWLLHSLPDGENVHPDGAAHRELFVLGEGDTSPVWLTDDLSMEFSYFQRSVQWGPGDEFVSWVAHKWVDGEVVDAGIYAAPLQFDTNGDIVGLADEPELVVEMDTYEVYDSNIDAWVVVPDARYDLDWSPDGTKVIWQYRGAARLQVTDISSDPPATTELTDSAANFAVWSSQDEIAYLASGAVHRISPDGSGDEVLYQARSNLSLHYLAWSPDGETLAFEQDGNRTAIYTLAVDKPRPKGTGVRGQPKRWLSE